MKRSMRPRGRRVLLVHTGALRDRCAPPWAKPASMASFVALFGLPLVYALMNATAPLSHTHAFQAMHLTHTHTTHVRSQPCTLKAIATRRSPPSSAPSSSLSTLCESHEGKSTCLYEGKASAVVGSCG